MALQNLGEPPSRPNDYADLTYLAEQYPFINTRVQTDVDYTVAFPSSPVDFSMFLVDVVAGPSSIIVTIPNTVLLTVGLATSYALPATKTGFFGFRYSALANAWFLLSAGTQA